MRNLCLMLVVVLASCSTATSPVAPAAPLGVGAATSNVVTPVAICPMVHKKYSSGKASTVFANKLVFFGFSTKFSWTVTFSGLSSTSAPVTYVPSITTCGLENGKKPFGTIQNLGQTGHRSHCDNGVCTVKVTYSVGYTPRSVKNRFHKAWVYDFIRFVPTSTVAEYGALPAFRVEVGPPPA